MMSKVCTCKHFCNGKRKSRKTESECHCATQVADSEIETHGQLARKFQFISSVRRHTYTILGKRDKAVR
jgi:hypothetical protein